MEDGWGGPHQHIVEVLDGDLSPNARAFISRILEASKVEETQDIVYVPWDVFDDLIRDLSWDAFDELLAEVQRTLIEIQYQTSSGETRYHRSPFIQTFSLDDEGCLGWQFGPNIDLFWSSPDLRERFH